MANPDFVDESVADQQGAGPITLIMPAAWSANQIALLFVASDGGQPTLSTPNGYVLATDPNGNSAFANAGTGICSIAVFWKRLVGSNSTTDPSPVIAAASTWGGTCIATHINTYSGCRTSGTPFHIIANAVVSSATTTIAPPAVTPTLNACTLVTCCASENDDAAFNAWTFSGAASPSGQLDNGWHSPTGNLCSFVGGRGGYATTGGSRSGTSTFGASTRQAQVTMVLASLNEIGVAEDVPPIAGTAIAGSTVMATPIGADEDVPPTATIADDTAPVATVVSFPGWQPAGLVCVEDDLPVAVAPPTIVEDPPMMVDATAFTVATPYPTVTSDDVTTLVTIDDEPARVAANGEPRIAWPSQTIDDDLPGGTAPSGFVDDSSMAPVAASLPSAIAWSPITDDTIGTPIVTATIGAGGDAQRSFQIPPQTGNLTTPSPIDSWAQNHAYVIDPTNGGINRVQNNGTLYQCSVAGTSSSTGTGPNATTPGSTQADGGVTWYVIGPVAPTDTTAGSQILVTVMRGNQSQTATVDPSDNDGGVYTAITNNAYAGFPASFAGVWRRTTAANAKTNFTASAVWGGSGGAGDEQSVAWVRLDGVVVGAPHTFSHVERASPTGGTVTAASITTTKRCLIVSFWHGNGTVQAAGQPDAATPAGGLTLVANATGPLSLTTAGYIQHMVAWRIANPGTFAEVWTASPTSQGAQLNTIAYETLDAGGSVEDIVGVTWGMTSPMPTMGVMLSADEMPRAITGDEPASAAATVTPLMTPADAFAGDDIVIAASVDDERGVPMVVDATAPVAPAMATTDDAIVAASPVEDAATTIADQVTPLALAASSRADEDIAMIADDAALLDALTTPTWPAIALTVTTPETIGTLPSDDPGSAPDWPAFVRAMAEVLTRDAEELGASPPPPPRIIDDDAQAPFALPTIAGLSWRAVYEEWAIASTAPIPHASIRVVVLQTATGVDMITTGPFRQGSTHGPLEAVAYTATRLVDFPTEYPGGVTFRMVSGSTIVTGVATGDSSGRLTYVWGDHDLDVAGTYEAVFIGMDAQGHTETFPRGTNIPIMVVPAL